tara:strand:- start:1061 stop:2173 length:1113 start_codon:yes stop_codon:yes gene_type:complete
MVTVTIGPTPDFNIDALCNYIAVKNELTELIYNGWNTTKQEIEDFCVPDGDYKLVGWEGVNLKVERNKEPYLPSDGGIMFGTTVVVEAESIATINTLIDAARELSRHGKDIDYDKGVPLWVMEHGWSLEGIIAHRPLDSVVLPGGTKDNIVQDMERFLSEDTENLHKSLNIPHTRIYMLHGPPGTGKTTLIHALASRFHRAVASVEFTAEVDDRALRRAFKNCPKDAWIAIEDIDCLFEERKNHDSARNQVTFSGLLNTLDGIGRLKDGTIIFITTNHLKKLDEALRRRVDYFVEYEFNTKEQTQEQFLRFFPKQADKWDDFWKDIRRLKLTPNILQKFFARHLLCDDITQHSKHVRDYITAEEAKDMYT